MRQLHAEYQRDHESRKKAQIDNLRRRITMIQWMQWLGVFCFFGCVVTMIFLFLHLSLPANIAFGISLFSLLGSLAVSLAEIHISVQALRIHLSDMEGERPAPFH